MDHAPAHRQTDAGAGNVLVVVQALEDLEHLVVMPGRDAASVVAHGEHPLPARHRFGRADVHAQRAVGTVLQGIAQQVEHELDEL